MSIKVMTAVWEKSQHAKTRLLLMLAIADYCDDNGRGCWASNSTLGDKCRMDSRSIPRLLAALAASGEITIEHRPGRTSVKNINLDRLGVRGDDLTSLPHDNLTFPHDNSSRGGDDIAMTWGDDIAMTCDPLLNHLDLDLIWFEAKNLLSSLLAPSVFNFHFVGSRLHLSADDNGGLLASVEFVRAGSVPWWSRFSGPVRRALTAVLPDGEDLVTVSPLAPGGKNGAA